MPTAAQGRTASLLAFRAGPVLLGDNHRSEGTLGFASCAQEEGSTRGTRVRGAPLLAIHDGPWADAPLRAPSWLCPSPGRFLASPLGLSPSQQQSQCLTPKAPARRSPELPTPICAMSRRDPRHGTARPAGRLPRPSTHFSLPTAGTASTANLIFVVINFCAEGEKKNHYGYVNNKNKIVFLKLKMKLACAVSQLIALRSRR